MMECMSCGDICKTHKVTGWTETGLHDLTPVIDEDICANCIHDYILKTNLIVDGVRQDGSEEECDGYEKHMAWECRQSNFV